MKNLRDICLSCCTGLAFLLFGQIAQGAISGTSHDLSGFAWSGGELCVVCHTPHNADIGTAQLWNHSINAAQAYTPYASATLNAVVGQPGNASKLCLSCHDGTLGVDAFGGSAGTPLLISNAIFPLGTGDVSTDLSNDHPIGFDYAATVAPDGELETLADAELAGMVFEAGQMECSTCHDVHGTGIPKFLRISNAASALCLACHIK